MALRMVRISDDELVRLAKKEPGTRRPSSVIPQTPLGHGVITALCGPDRWPWRACVAQRRAYRLGTLS